MPRDWWHTDSETPAFSAANLECVCVSESRTLYMNETCIASTFAHCETAHTNQWVTNSTRVTNSANNLHSWMSHELHTYMSHGLHMWVSHKLYICTSHAHCYELDTQSTYDLNTVFWKRPPVSGAPCGGVKFSRTSHMNTSWTLHSCLVIDDMLLLKLLPVSGASCVCVQMSHGIHLWRSHGLYSTTPSHRVQIHRIWTRWLGNSRLYSTLQLVEPRIWTRWLGNSRLSAARPVCV